jgi:hypothetical protein
MALGVLIAVLGILGMSYVGAIAEPIITLGAFLLWLGIARSMLRFTWFLLKIRESTLYDGQSGKIALNSPLWLWLMGLNEHGERVDQ